MSMTFSSESGVSGEASAYGGFVDALGGIATIVLAIIALAGVRAEILLPIATIVFGAALLIQGGAMLSEFALVEATPESSVGSNGAGLSSLFLVGVAGIVLGVLALLGVNPTMLSAVAVIAFGGALVVSASAVWQLLTSRSVASRFQAHGSVLNAVASEAAAGSSGVQGIAGLAVMVLGIGGHLGPDADARGVAGRRRCHRHDREHAERNHDRFHALRAARPRRHGATGRLASQGEPSTRPALLVSGASFHVTSGVRSRTSRAIAARNRGMPVPVREDVTISSGKAAGLFWMAAFVASTISASAPTAT